MNGRLRNGLFAASLLAAFALPSPASAADVEEFPGSWLAPDVAVTFGADFLENQADQAGPTFQTTIDEFWDDGACRYDANTGEPSDNCDRLRFGLELYRGPDSGSTCPSPIARAVQPQEDGGDLLTSGEYKVSRLQTKAGTLYCSDTAQRTLGDSLLAYRDQRFNDLGTAWPARPQLTLNVINSMPQTSDTQQDQVRKSLMAACELFEGNNNQYLSIPTWMMTTKGAPDGVTLFASMMAAAGGTGQCCYDAQGGNCDPSDPNDAIDMCDHLRTLNGSVIEHDESKLRQDIRNENYKCLGTPKLTSPGNMETDNFSDVKCHLNGASCGNLEEPAKLWQVFSCIQRRPDNIAPADLSVEYCGSIDGDGIDSDYGDDNGDGCITLTPGNGIEWVDDEQKNLFYLSADSYRFPDANGTPSGDRVQSATGSGRTASATFSQQPLEGNLLVAMSAHRVDWTEGEMLNDGWTRVVNLVDFGSDNNKRRGLAVWYKIAGDREPSTVETTWTGGGTHRSRHNTLLIQEFSGAFTLDVSTTNSTGGSALKSISTGTTATSADGASLVITSKAMRDNGSAASWTNGFGENLRVLSTNLDAPSDTTLQSAYRAASTAQTWESTASWTGDSGEAVAAVLSFNYVGGRLDINDDAFCEGIAQGDSWTTIPCSNQGLLCDLEDGSQCSLGRSVCYNNVSVCERFPGNDTCDSAACAKEQVHTTKARPPNVQFLVDRSGSMSGGRWASAKDVATSLARWSYQGSGCADDGTNCDRTRLGVHFWSGIDGGWGSDEVNAISAQEDTTGAEVDDAFDANPPDGGTDFHQAARLLENEAALTDTARSNFGIFITDGVAEHAFTTREAVRNFCDLRRRSSAPIGTYSVGFAAGNANLNSIVAAAGGSGQCCFSSDGTCDTEPDYSPCDLYDYELANGEAIVTAFHDWISGKDSLHDEWHDLNDRFAAASRTGDSFNAGRVADDLELVDDVSRWLIKADYGFDPQNLDCQNDGGDLTSTDDVELLKGVLCETKKTLSYTIRHRYGGQLAEDLSSWSDFNPGYDDNHDSTFIAHNYECSGSKYADDEDQLLTELQVLLSSLECTYPLTMLDNQQSAPLNTDSTKVNLYMPAYDVVVGVPHTDDTQALQDFRDEMCSLNVPNCDNFGDDGWSFANEGRTAIKLTAELCDFSNGDSVERLTTQVCQTCDPDQVGSPCGWVQCTPTEFEADYGFDATGVKCEQVEHPCPDDPETTCTSWAKTGRCGMGEYACGDDGLPYCEQVHSRMPEICNGVDDDCDGGIDDLVENRDQWSEDKYDIRGEEYDGWYCGYRDTCRCPDRQADSIGGYKTDADEFASMLQHQQENGQCECGEGISADYELTRTYSDGTSQADDPKAGCSAAGSGSAGGGFAATVIALLFGVFGLRRRRG